MVVGEAGEVGFLNAAARRMLELADASLGDWRRALTLPESAREALDRLWRLPVGERRPLRTEVAGRAVEIDDASATAHLALGSVHIQAEETDLDPPVFRGGVLACQPEEACDTVGGVGQPCVR